MFYMLLIVHFSKMGRSRHCSEEQGSLIRKWIEEGKTYKHITYKEAQKMIGCSAKRISNSFKMVTKTRETWKISENYDSTGLKNSQNTTPKMTCEYCNNWKTPMWSKAIDKKPPPKSHC